jgi:hypothetical protein
VCAAMCSAEARAVVLELVAGGGAPERGRGVDWSEEVEETQRSARCSTTGGTLATCSVLEMRPARRLPARCSATAGCQGRARHSVEAWTWIGGSGLRCLMGPLLSWAARNKNRKLPAQNGILPK